MGIYGNKKAIMLACIGWGVMMIAQFRAYQLGKATQVAPLSALTVILNVIVGYLFFKRKKEDYSCCINNN